MRPAKTAELIEISFELWTWVGPRNLVLDGDANPRGKEQFFWGKGAAHCRDILL